MQKKFLRTSLWMVVPTLWLLCMMLPTTLCYAPTLNVEEEERDYRLAIRRRAELVNICTEIVRCRNATCSYFGRDDVHKRSLYQCASKSEFNRRIREEPSTWPANGYADWVNRATAFGGNYHKYDVSWCKTCEKWIKRKGLTEAAIKYYEETEGGGY